MKVYSRLGGQEKMNSLKNLLEFVRTDLWRIRLKYEPPRKSFWIRQLRILILSVREFMKDKCLLRASALTFYTLVSIVPLMAVAFGIAQGFHFEKHLENHIRQKFLGKEDVIVSEETTGEEPDRAPSGEIVPEESDSVPDEGDEKLASQDEAGVDEMEVREQVINRVFEISNRVLDNAKGGLVAGIGVVILIWTVIKVLGYIEQSFNDIFGVKKPRTWPRKLSDYLFFVFISPIVFVVASSITVLFTSEITVLVTRLEIWGWVGGLIFVCLKILPFSLIWALFTFTYLFMPNTKVKFSSALLGGIIGGTLFQLIQWMFIVFQIGISRYGAIYGSLAALPFLLFWLKTSWLIVLYGAEIAFAHQFVDTYEFEPDCLKVSPAYKKLLILGVAHYCVRSFQEGEKPPTSIEISDNLDMPIRLVNQILYELVEAGILSEVQIWEEQTPAYQPAKDICDLTIQEVLTRIEAMGTENIPLADTPEIKKIAENLKTMKEIQITSPANLKLKDV